MTNTYDNIFAVVDHTLLNPQATWQQIQVLCEEAIKYKTASVCIPPCYVANVYEKYKDKISICTVIGFPLGYQITEVKIKEAEEAIKHGAKEIDMVINIADVKNKNYDTITNEIYNIKKIIGDNTLKVIIETCYLTEEEKIQLCKCVTDAGANYIKTSTGFGSGGATLEDISLLKKHIGSDVKIKASGGIRTKHDFEAFILAGCDRIGTSSAIKILIHQQDSEFY